MTLHGHDAAIAAFRDALGSGRMHHAWLLAGPRGVGKGRFARMAAARMLAEAAGPPPQGDGLAVEENHPTRRLINAWSHPDHILLDRLPPKRNPMRERPRDEWPDDVELSRNISVEQVRKMGERFFTRPTYSDCRVVIIDSADDLEREGANALLKNLEEPPAGTIFLLVCHNLGRLLPTLRSRCSLLRFARLEDDAMASALAEAAPALSSAEREALVRAGRGTPGQALRYAGLDIAGIDGAIAELITHGDPGNARRGALADTLSPKSAQRRYEAFLERAPSAIAAHARGLRGPRLAAAIRAWEEARDLATAAPRLTLDPQATVFELAGKLAGLSQAR